MTHFNGNSILRDLTKQAGYPSLAHLVAKHTLFTHPDTVKQTHNQNLFRIIRNASRRGEMVDYSDGKKVMYCDNEGPNRAFVWSNGGIKYQDVQLNHIYSDSQNVNVYTSLANLCMTPAFIAKLTDTDLEIKALLKYRSFDLYGFYLEKEPIRPIDYESLNWMPFLPSLTDLEKYLQSRLISSKKSRSSTSAREIGWLFSNFEPDKHLIL